MWKAMLVFLSSKIKHALENLGVFDGLADMTVVEEEKGFLCLSGQRFGLLDPFFEFVEAVKVIVAGTGTPPRFGIAAVEADIADRGRCHDDRGHEATDLGFIHTDEADSVALEQALHIEGQPTPMTEFDEVGEICHSGPAGLDVGSMGRRVPKAPGDLGKNPLEFAGFDQRTDSLSEPMGYLDISAFVGGPSMCLHDEAEALGSSVRHALEGPGRKQLVEGRIDLYDVEVASIEHQPIPAGEVEGIEDPSPAIKAVARCADLDNHLWNKA